MGSHGRFIIRIFIADTASHPRGSSRPSFALSPCPQLKEGAGKTGCRPGTHGPLCDGWQQESAQRHTGGAEHPAFPAQWFDGLCRALPGERCTIAPVALQMTDAKARLGRTHHHETWRTGSGRQDHTILPYADHTGRARDAPRSRLSRPAKPSRADGTCVHRRPARVRDDRDTPLFLGPE